MWLLLPDRTYTLWLCLSCVHKTSDNTEDLTFGLIAGQPLNMSQNKGSYFMPVVGLSLGTGNGAGRDSNYITLLITQMMADLLDPSY
jgi:hypothetical protein